MCADRRSRRHTAEDFIFSHWLILDIPLEIIKRSLVDTEYLDCLPKGHSTHSAHTLATGTRRRVSSCPKITALESRLPIALLVTCEGSTGRVELMGPKACWELMMISRRMILLRDRCLNESFKSFFVFHTRNGYNSVIVFGGWFFPQEIYLGAVEGAF